MLKYVDSLITFSEVPDEVTLCINISNCPCHCEGCHSSYLAENIGKVLNLEAIQDILIDKRNQITCISFMGGDSDPHRIYELCKEVQTFLKLKTAWYSGRQELPKFMQRYLNGKRLKYFNYIKLGPYIKEKGPLNNPNTNQRFYEIVKQNSEFILKDITHKFWK